MLSQWDRKTLVWKARSPIMVLLLKWTWQHRALDKNVNGYDVWENVQENSSLIEKTFRRNRNCAIHYEDNYSVACPIELELFKKTIVRMLLIDFLIYESLHIRIKNFKWLSFHSYIHYELRQRLQKIWGNNNMYF